MSWQAELSRMEKQDALYAVALGKALDEMGINHKPLHRGSCFSHYSILPKPPIEYQLAINTDKNQINVFKNCEHGSMTLIGKVDLSLPVAERKAKLDEFIAVSPVPCGALCNDDEEIDDDEIDE